MSVSPRRLSLTSNVFLPRAPLLCRALPWLQAAGSLSLGLVALTASVAVAARILPAPAEERGKPDIIELAAIETSTESEQKQAAADAPEQLEESRKEIDEVKAEKAAQDLPQEQASPEKPLDDLRMAQEQTEETVEKTEAPQATEKQDEKAVTAPASQASLAAEYSEALEGKPQDTTATAPDVGSARDGENRMLEWQKKLFRHIGHNKFYPAEARKKGQKGEALIAFTLDAEGRISHVRIARSSGRPLLDQAALDTMRKSDPAPRPPSSGTMALEIPIRFALK